MAKKIFKEDEGEISLLEVAEQIKDIRESTKDKIKLVLTEPSKENVNSLVFELEHDKFLSLEKKQSLLSVLKRDFISLFNLENCPDDYESLKF